jgi:hypothetical protein
MSWEALKDRVALELGFEGHAISDQELLVQANIAISIISARAPKLVVATLAETGSNQAFYGAQINTVTGKYVEVVLPPEYFLIETVWVNGVPAKATAFDQFEQLDTGDAEQFAIADRRLRVNHTTLSEVKLYCRRELDPYNDVVATFDPLADFPPRFRLLPAAYVLLQYPANPDVPRESLRLQRNTALWEAGLQDIAQVAADRSTSRWRL